jgi:hypothetical protein
MPRFDEGFGWEDWPLLRRDVIASTRQPVFFLWRLLFLGLIGGMVWTHTLSVAGSLWAGRSLSRSWTVRPLDLFLFSWFEAGACGLACVLGPILGCTAFARERRPGEFTLLLTTPLSGLRIVAEVVLARGIIAAILTLGLVPIVLITPPVGGEPSDLGMVLPRVWALLWLGAALAVVVSIRVRRVRDILIVSYAILLFWQLVALLVAESGQLRTGTTTPFLLMTPEPLDWFNATALVPFDRVYSDWLYKSYGATPPSLVFQSVIFLVLACGVVGAVTLWSGLNLRSWNRRSEEGAGPAKQRSRSWLERLGVRWGLIVDSDLDEHPIAWAEARRVQLSGLVGWMLRWGVNLAALSGLVLLVGYGFVLVCLFIDPHARFLSRSGLFMVMAMLWGVWLICVQVGIAGVGLAALTASSLAGQEVRGDDALLATPLSLEEILDGKRRAALRYAEALAWGIGLELAAWLAVSVMANMWWVGLIDELSGESSHKRLILAIAVGAAGLMLARRFVVLLAEFVVALAARVASRFRSGMASLLLGVVLPFALLYGMAVRWIVLVCAPVSVVGILFAQSVNWDNPIGTLVGMVLLIVADVVIAWVGFRSWRSLNPTRRRWGWRLWLGNRVLIWALALPTFFLMESDWIRSFALDSELLLLLILAIFFTGVWSDLHFSVIGLKAITPGEFQRTLSRMPDET